jgi:alkanesulfonate monooxygenase SsuD/methylene tetrahydromethanopterin reductase-like flavin-dependent oxidoreductase (luciferase family)
MADGFHPLGLAGDLLDERLAQLREAAETAGRDPSSVELSLGGVLDQLDEERISVAAAAGAHRLVLGTRESDLDKLKDAMSAVADRFLTTTTGRN